MDDYAGRVLADRYRLPLTPSDEYELVETRAFDTYSGQEVLVRQVPLPEVVEAEVVDADGPPGTAPYGRTASHTPRRRTDPAVLRAVEAAQAAARIPDHPRLDQVFDVFAEAGSLWIVSERVAARPLAALLAEKPLTPYRAAEVASDVLTALLVLHAHGWTHRNITSRTVLVCDDGRIVLTGLAAGAAEEALCGYAPVPVEAPEELPPYDDEDGYHPYGGQGSGDPDHEDPDGDDDGEFFDEDEDHDEDDDGYGTEDEEGGEEAEADPEYGHQDNTGPGPVRPYERPVLPGAGVPDSRAARAGAIAAYRAGARAAARDGGDDGGSPVQTGHDPDWWARGPFWLWSRKALIAIFLARST
ncbi:protein kinase, partial [Streptomyces katsurahamanus]